MDEVELRIREAPETAWLNFVLDEKYLTYTFDLLKQLRPMAQNSQLKSINLNYLGRGVSGC